MQQRKIYLVDTENIGSRWMTLCETFSKYDKLLLFHTNEAMKFTFEDMRYLQPYMSQVHMIHCYNGTPNALDFQLCAVNGYLFAADKESEYVIVSNDSGYDRMIHFMKGMGQNISRMKFETTQKHGEKQVTAKQVRTEKFVTIERVKSVLGGQASQSDVNAIVKMLNSLHANPNHIIAKDKKVEVNNRLQKLSHTRGSEYYRKLKSSGLLADL